MRQTSFSFIQDYKKQFGGSLLLGKRKSKRPLSTKSPIHLILKSESGKFFNPRNESLDQLIRYQAKKFNIKIYDLAQNWSHIHLLIRLHSREDYVKFIRALTSIMAARIRRHLGESGHRNESNLTSRSAHMDTEKIFTLRPFTRVVSWGRDFRNALRYHRINILEAFGKIRRAKKTKLVSKKRKSITEKTGRIFTRQVRSLAGQGRRQLAISGYAN